ncbi:MAG: toprim domain-containing protein [Spirochaetaceae bacterium]|nr:toprim domain-containing protein [Spirochaetaceae bacterium]
MAPDFEKYKPRLKDYLRQKNVDVSINPTHCFNTSGHKNGDANPSLQIWDDSFKCYGCGINGDIYDAVEILEGITDKKEQYDFIEKFCGGAPVTPIQPYKSVWGKDGEDFKPETSAMKEFENFLNKNIAAKDQIKKFLCKRAGVSVKGAAEYPHDIQDFMIEQFLYWPGLGEVRKYLGNDILKKCGIPLINPNTGHSTWEHSGVVMRLGTGYKLHYYEKNYCKNCKDKNTCPKHKEGGFCEICEKRTSKGGKTFPMPGAVDTSLPVILVEGEMNALSCAAIGIKNLFSAGGTNGLTGPKVKQYLLSVPEIILFFDADEPGRKASGLDPLNETDKRKTNIPQVIQRAGYTGKIKCAELPPVSETGYKDQDALIIAGKRDIINAAIASAREWVPPPPPLKKIYTPFSKFNFLSIKRLSHLLKKLERKYIDKKDIGAFISACLTAFPHAETKGLLKQWGAAGEELVENKDVSPYFILTVIEKHLSRYLVREIEREITPVEEFIKNIKIQDIKFELDFEEIEISQNARNFFYTGGMRSAALMLADIFHGNIIYNDAKNDKHFYFYDGHVWKHEPDITGVIYNTLLSVLVHFAKQRKEKPDADEDAKSIDKKFHMVLNRVEDRRVRKDIEREFSGLKYEGVYHNSDDKSDVLHFDGPATRETLTLIDGVFDMSGDKIAFRKSRPEEYRKMVLPYTIKQVRELPDKYFWEFMRGNFKNEDTLQTFMFYLSLIASRVQYKYGAFLIGGKNTGKSTTIKMIEGVYKDLIGTMDADVLVPKGKTFATGNGPTPYLAQLDGLGASIISETEEGATLNAGLWKKLTGNDKIPARGLNEAPKNFINTAQIIISTNILPRFDKRDESIITRMIVIPFLVSHERDEKDAKRPDDIIRDLEPEYPAIIRVLADYYIKLKNEHGGVIPVSKESNSYKVEIIAELASDLDRFVNVNISFEKNHMEAIKEIYNKYMAYFDFDENSVKRGEALSRNRFTKYFLKNYKDYATEDVQRVKGNVERVFIGVRIKTFDEMTEARAKEKENASTQAAAPPTVQNVVPEMEPKDDENPFD